MEPPQLYPTLRILLAQSDPAEIENTRKALDLGRISYQLEVTANGAQTLERLKTRTAKQGPDLVLLDLDLPQADATPVLDVIRKDEDMAGVPLILLAAQNDAKRRSQDRPARRVEKPLTLHGFIDALQGIDRFWLRVTE